MAQRKEEEAKRQREAYMMQFGELLGGQSVGEAPMTPGIDGSLEGMGPQAMPTAPQLPDQAAIIRSLMTAPEGVDTRSLMALYEASKPPERAKPLIVGGSVLDPVTYKPLYEQPDRPERLPMGYVRNPDGSLSLDTGYLQGQQKLATVKRAPPRAAGGGGGSAAPKLGKGPVIITSKAQYDALPPGTSYKAPDGSTRTKR
jgi:hypothetical protein